MLYIVQFEDKPDMGELREKLLQSHFDFLDRMKDRVLVPGSMREVPERSTARRAVDRRRHGRSRREGHLQGRSLLDQRHAGGLPHQPLAEGVSGSQGADLVWLPAPATGSGPKAGGPTRVSDREVSCVSANRCWRPPGPGLDGRDRRADHVQPAARRRSRNAGLPSRCARSCSCPTRAGVAHRTGRHAVRRGADQLRPRSAGRAPLRQRFPRVPLPPGPANKPSVYAEVGKAFPLAVYNRLESGFIAFAFHPEFAKNGLFYTVHAERAIGQSHGTHLHSARVYAGRRHVSQHHHGMARHQPGREHLPGDAA